MNTYYATLSHDQHSSTRIDIDAESFDDAKARLRKCVEDGCRNATTGSVYALDDSLVYRCANRHGKAVGHTDTLIWG